MTEERKDKYVNVAGVRVHVILDAEGRPRMALAGVERPTGTDHDEGFVTLAAKAAYADAAHDAERAGHERAVAVAVSDAVDATELAQQTKRKRDSDKGVLASKKKRAKNVAGHWTNKWYELAYAERPCGWKTLAHAARGLAKAGGVEPAELDEITEHRTRQFIKRQRNTGKRDENGS